MTNWFMALSPAQRTGIVYAIVLAGWLCGLEIPAARHQIPILTLSSDVRHAIKWWHPVALMVPFFFLVLSGHFDRGWSVLYLIGTAAIIIAAILLHFFKVAA